ncbi:hypothetical protein V5O48_014947, partial [Marasmius crinis-equi]
KGPPLIHRDKFAEIPGDCTPPVLEVWANAVKSIDQSRRPAKGTVKNSGYAFPDPGMILFAPPDRRSKMLKTWLRFRSALTFRHMMDPPCVASSAWSPHQWRMLLAITETHTKPAGQGFIAQERQVIQTLLSDCCRFNNLTLHLVDDDPYQFRWRNQLVPAGLLLNDPKMVQEVVWELFELNFRFELHALVRMFLGHTRDFSAGVGEATTFDDEVNACFFQTKGMGNPSDPDVHGASAGLAAATLAHRKKYIVRFAGVLAKWPDSEEGVAILAGRKTTKEFSDADLTKLEEWAARFYCQTFYSKFGRPPIIPHRLDRLVDLSPEDESDHDVD